MLLYSNLPFDHNTRPTNLGRRSDIACEGTIRDEATIFAGTSGILQDLSLKQNPEASDQGLESVQIDLVSLARQSDGDVLEFIEALESECCHLLSSGTISADFYGLAACIMELHNAAKAGFHQDLKTEILGHIDEVRRVGEVCFPVFNVSVA